MKHKINQINIEMKTSICVSKLACVDLCFKFCLPMLLGIRQRKMIFVPDHSQVTSTCPLPRFSTVVTLFNLQTKVTCILRNKNKCTCLSVPKGSINVQKPSGERRRIYNPWNELRYKGAQDKNGWDKTGHSTFFTNISRACNSLTTHIVHIFQNHVFSLHNANNWDWKWYQFPRTSKPEQVTTKTKYERENELNSLLFFGIRKNPHTPM